MNLVCGWAERLAATARRVAEKHAQRLLASPVDLPRLAGSTELLVDADAARRWVSTLQRTAVSAVALDSEFAFATPELELRSGRRWNDIRSTRPICVSAAAWVDGHVLRAVFDVRVSEVAAALAELLRLRVLFVYHQVKAELFAFWALGLDPDFHQLYDTCLAAACLNLGRYHRRSQAAAETTEAERIGAVADLERSKAHLLSLVGQCEHYGLGYPLAGNKDLLRASFAELGNESQLSPQQIEYAAADAEWTLRLYAAQQPDILAQGIASHLHVIEFPFAAANARMEWTGVNLDDHSCEKLRIAAGKAAEHYAHQLKSLGIDPPGSVPKFRQVMAEAMLVSHFERGGQFSTENDQLELLEHLHPAIRSFRLHRKYRRLAAEEWLHGAMRGADGRIHPEHLQLGADTGRNSCRSPNIAGIGKIFRPIVTAPPGRALVELDYGQIEVGVAAGEHDDLDLIAAYNSGDVYASMAQRFYASALTKQEQAATPSQFKRLRPDLRDRMKTFVLAVIYNIQAPAIAARFGISIQEAERERERFLDLYPKLKRGLEASAAHGAARGHAAVVSGLRRRTERRGRGDSWTQNFLRNTPIQGSAAVVFKRAVVDLDRAFRGTSTWLVLPIHDAILIECDLDQLDRVADRAVEIMRNALRSFYPKLEPRVDVNKAHPWCWNKDGHADSFDRFVQDPEFRIDAPLRSDEHAASESPAPDRASTRADDPGCGLAVSEPQGNGSNDTEAPLASHEHADSRVEMTAELRSDITGRAPQLVTPEPCYCCRGTRFFRRDAPGAAGWVCAKCHPPVEPVERFLWHMCNAAAP